MSRQYAVIREWVTPKSTRRIVVGPYTTKYRADKAIEQAQEDYLSGKFYVALFRSPDDNSDEP